MNLIFRVIAKLLNKTVIMVFKVNLLIFLLVLSFGCIEVDFVGEEMSHTTFGLVFGLILMEMEC